MQLVYFFVFYVDQLCLRAEEIGQETFVTIADLEGFSMANFSLTYIKVIVSILQNHYPERLGTVYVINAPFIFSAAWRMIQPLLDERTRSKIEILGSSPADYARIQTDVDVSVLEQDYGGTHERYPVPDEIVQLSLVDPSTSTSPRIFSSSLSSRAAAISDGAARGPICSSVIGAQEAEDQQPKSPLFGQGKTRRRIKHLLKRALFITESRASSASLGLDPNKDDDDAARKPSLLRSVSRRLWAREQADDDDAEEITATVDERIAVELRESHDKLLVQMSTLSSAHEVQIMQLQHQVQALSMVLVAILLFWVFHG